MKDSLEHIGIMGMRWHHKKGTVTTKSQVPPEHIHNSDDHEKKVSIGKKKANELSNDELRAFSQRVILEKQYKDLSKKQLSPGVKWVKDLMISTAKQSAETYVKKYAAKQMEELMKKASKAGD